MVKLTINGKQIEVEKGLSLIQACELAEVEIPRFCYHDKLKVAGSCRACLVEIEKMDKLVASCATPVSEGMVVHTDSEKVKKAREGALEFLLVNHPLECPICDQGGECDLQDQAMVYGKGASRFCENKRAVEDKNMGPLIETHMNRCIHCTRCVRFINDIAGTGELAVFGLGDQKGYPENFCDAIGILVELLEECGAKVVGHTTLEGYNYESSKAERGGEFVGLPLDQENQARLTKGRIERWIKQLSKEMK